AVYVWVPARALFAMFPPDVRAKVPDSLGFPFPGGWLIGGVMLVNMTLAYFVRYNHFTWKRTGVYILHSGLVVMMASEVITGLFAVEGQMAIEEGDSSNVVVQSRYYELAVTSPDSADPAKYLAEVVVPARMLKKSGATVQDAALPFDVEVKKYMPNSELRKLAPGETGPANKAAGLEYAAEERAEVSGTAKKQSSDMPSVYLILKKSGEEIGTYLMSLHLNPQTVTVGDKTYKVALRFKQTYLPFSIKLNEFRFDRWEGTDMARNFSSNVDVIDRERGDSERNVVIKMNDPLRYGGETFYQQDFDHNTERTTILQVVRNPGWLLPYVSCVLVALGMMIHFGMHLTTFLGRRRAA
ncbi:MAG TPA: cytochrome c biogenesis protein ResB, partial [Gemmataceae bacterium]|nr:cytochrome c biogenesis protein ResB [Gemmataceae bacterium]